MIYLKSILAGLAAVGVSMLLVSVLTFGYVQLRLLMERRVSPGDTFFVVVHLDHFSFASLVTGTIVFACGAYWMYRRLRRV